MANYEIRSTVLEILRKIAPETDPGRLSGEKPLRSQMDLDSMDWLNVLIALRERLGIEIPESEYESLSTLDGMLAYLAARIEQQEARG